MCTHRDRHVLTHSFPTRRPSGLLTGWPVLLVVDAEGAGQSVAAVAHGLATFPGAPPVAGVIVNRVASDRHAAMIAEGFGVLDLPLRSEEHTSELQSLIRISYAVFCLKKKKHNQVRKSERV